MLAPPHAVPESPDSMTIEGIVELLDGLLSPLQARLRRDQVQALAQRVLAIADPNEGTKVAAMAAESWHDGLLDPHTPILLGSLAVLLIRVAKQLQAELGELDLVVAGHVEAYARAKTEAARRRRLEQMIEETAASERAVRGDRRALGRHLDLDALRERFDHRRDDLLVSIELAVMAMAPAASKALETASASATASAQVRELLNQADPVGFSLSQLQALRRWPSRLACLVALTELLGTLGLPEASAGQRHASPEHLEYELSVALSVIGGDRGEHEWVQAQAIACLRQVDLGRARELIAERLGFGGARPDPLPVRDFLVRRLLITQLCSGVEDEADLALLLRAVEQGDPSEHVRMAHCEALVALARVRPEAISDWARVLTRGPDPGRDDAGETPRVRARACLALGEAFRDVLELSFGPSPGASASGMRLSLSGSGSYASSGAYLGLGAGSSQVARSGSWSAKQRLGVIDAVVEGLAGCIATDASALVAKVACEQAVCVLEFLDGATGVGGHKRARKRLEAQVTRFERALHACLLDDTRHASIHEAAADALEGIDACLRPDRKAWTRALEAAVREIPAGQARRISVPRREDSCPSEDDLGRIFAQITRNDWGLDVEPLAGGSLRVHRGDRRVTRFWRLLHELRNPANNKRQGVRHTTGRRYVGRLRAHPGRLDEVTATVVPGERLHLEPEGGWSRHLPLIDDLLGMAWIRPRPEGVTLNSSFGQTRLRLSGSLGQRLRRRFRLDLRYAELAEQRRRALLSTEPEERRRFADTLREDYGIELEFEAYPALSLGGVEAASSGKGRGARKGRKGGGRGRKGRGRGRRVRASEGGSAGPGPRPVPSRLEALFPKPEPKPKPKSKSKSKPRPKSGSEVRGQVGLGAMAASLGLGSMAPNLDAWARDHLHYFLSLEGNSQEALGLFGLGLSALFLGGAYRRRRRIAAARRSIPLSVGGWGTRGKSGTERLKAGLFHGLGFRTFSKTTGCEAMFIHAAPGNPQVEIFTFRPYGKATIWEQRDLLELASGLGAQVFLWECMALNPEYVDILQNGWMRDDYATITNTYPDHEDIQGPAGIDVAEVIARFVPEGNQVISSELGFNPVLRDSAQRRGAEFIELGDHEGDLIAEDLLALFPYSEHPRNIALVTELARQLDIDPELAIVTMADYVYPDLGVLKRYPEVEVHGRRIEFVNGCSANERAGFLNNWHRTGCSELSRVADPAQMVVTVVNNRDDRVSRSEVFSRLLVEDVTVDAHVLIGTNLAGLQIFIDRALAKFVVGLAPIDADGLATGAGHERARDRLRATMMRVRAPIEGWWPRVATQLRLGLHALGLEPPTGLEASVSNPTGTGGSETSEAVHARVQALRTSADGSLDFGSVCAEVRDDRVFDEALSALVRACSDAPQRGARWEVGVAPSRAEFERHLYDRVARVVIAGRLEARLESVLETRDTRALTRLSEALTRAWVTLFKAQIVVVTDAAATGDQIIDQVAKSVPPGVHATVLGTQNIKGTGLDFIYRWLALDAVRIGLEQLRSSDEQLRLDALRALDSHSDFGFTDTGTMALRLGEFRGGSARELTLRAALLDKASKIHAQKLAGLESGVSGAAAKGGWFWTWIEGWIDFIDGAVRYRQSRRLVDDLIHYRVSHNKMAVEMREIYARAKGGWLGKYLSARIGRSKSGDEGVLGPGEGAGDGEEPVVAAADTDVPGSS